MSSSQCRVRVGGLLMGSFFGSQSHNYFIMCWENKRTSTQTQHNPSVETHIQPRRHSFLFRHPSLLDAAGVHDTVSTLVSICVMEEDGIMCRWQIRRGANVCCASVAGWYRRFMARLCVCHRVFWRGGRWCVSVGGVFKVIWIFIAACLGR